MGTMATYGGTTSKIEVTAGSIPGQFGEQTQSTLVITTYSGTRKTLTTEISMSALRLLTNYGVLKPSTSVVDFLQQFGATA